MAVYTGTTAAKASSVTIPATVSDGSTTYKVTSIASGVFQNNKKIKSLTIGKNITSIGKNAFSGCTNLKNVKIQSSSLTAKSFGANSFKGLHAKAKIKVPAKKLQNYKKWLKKVGVKGKKQKITK